MDHGIEAETRSCRAQYAIAMRATWLALLVGGACGIALLVMAPRLQTRVAPLLTLGALLYLGVVAGLALAMRMQHARLQAVAQDPGRAIDWLIEQAGAELRWWIGRRAVAGAVFAAILLPLLLVPAWSHALQAADGGRSVRVVLTGTVLAVALLALTVPVTIWRVRVLRARIARWTALRDEPRGA